MCSLFLIRLIGRIIDRLFLRESGISTITSCCSQNPNVPRLTRGYERGVTVLTWVFVWELWRPSQQLLRVCSGILKNFDVTPPQMLVFRPRMGFFIPPGAEGSDSDSPASPELRGLEESHQEVSAANHSPSVQPVSRPASTNHRCS